MSRSLIIQTTPVQVSTRSITQYPSTGTYCFVIIFITSCATSPPRKAAVLGRSAVGERALQREQIRYYQCLGSREREGRRTLRLRHRRTRRGARSPVVGAPARRPSVPPRSVEATRARRQPGRRVRGGLRQLWAILPARKLVFDLVSRHLGGTRTSTHPRQRGSHPTRRTSSPGGP